MEPAEDVPSAAIEGRDGEERSLVDRNIFAHDVRAVEEIVCYARNPQPPVRRVVVVNRQPADVHVFAVRDIHASGAAEQDCDAGGYDAEVGRAADVKVHSCKVVQTRRDCERRRALRYCCIELRLQLRRRWHCFQCTAAVTK